MVSQLPVNLVLELDQTDFMCPGGHSNDESLDSREIIVPVMDTQKSVEAGSGKQCASEYIPNLVLEITPQRLIELEFLE